MSSSEVEQGILNPYVEGSIPSSPSKLIQLIADAFSNGYEQFHEATPTMQMRYEWVALAIESHYASN